MEDITGHICHRTGGGITMKQSKSAMKSRNDAWFSFMLLIPAVVTTLVFILIPVVDSVIKSFMKYEIKNIISGKPGVWNKFGNYIRLFQNDKLPQSHIR